MAMPSTAPKRSSQLRLDSDAPAGPSPLDSSYPFARRTVVTGMTLQSANDAQDRILNRSPSKVQRCCHRRFCFRQWEGTSRRSLTSRRGQRLWREPTRNIVSNADPLFRQRQPLHPLPLTGLNPRPKHMLHAYCEVELLGTGAPQDVTLRAIRSFRRRRHPGSERVEKPLTARSRNTSTRPR